MDCHSSAYKRSIFKSDQINVLKMMDGSDDEEEEIVINYAQLPVADVPLAQRPILESSSLPSPSVWTIDTLEIGLAPIYPNAIVSSEGKDLVTLNNQVATVFEITSIGYPREPISSDEKRFVYSQVEAPYPSEMPQTGASVNFFRSACFSPLGCATDGGSLLVLLQDNYQVTVHAPSQGSWVPFIDLGDLLMEHHRKNSFKEDDEETTDPDEYARRVDLTGTLCVAWSPMVKSPTSDHLVSYLALGGRSDLSIWVFHPSKREFEMVSCFEAHDSWTNHMVWSLRDDAGHDEKNSKLHLYTGCTDGSVKKWSLEYDEGDAVYTMELKSTLCKPDKRSVHLLAYSQSHRCLAIAKVSSIWIYSFSTEKMYKRSVAHGSPITGVCWMKDEPILFTCSSDGHLFSWDFDEESNENIKKRRNVSKSTDGYFGIVLSHNDLFIWSIERRMPTKKDSMYERRKPYARVNIHPLDGYECTLEDQTGAYRDYVDVSDITKACEKAGKSRTLDLIETLHQLYNDEGEGDGKRCGPLRLATYLSKWLGESTKDMEFELRRQHVYKCLTKSREHEGELREREKQSLLIMADWVVENKKKMSSAMLEAASSVYKRVDRNDLTASDTVPPPRDHCPYCEAEVSLTDSNNFLCPNGHSLTRCRRTFLVIDTADVWNCTCNSESLMLEGEAEKGIEGKFPWLEGERNVCPSCGSALFALSFKSHVTKGDKRPRE
ncbi:hypothetical protein PROFUN_02166 [Planoprotostelium fungivorum]|uniref:Uncharacterized protein n=1 Tax=Planoprotostelium fungivorum TaxID=1890364 RepID=A0A2P6NZC3_9EUKA|nr:hypothetical protein PROFUN_02166 [Planoprotostelium fungivorum]